MDYLEGLRLIVERSPAFRGKRVQIVVIANPAAGGFTIRKRAAQNRQTWATVLEWVLPNPPLARSCTARVHLTSRSGHAREIAGAVADEILRGEIDADCVLLVSVGGDGTHHEIQTSLAERMLEREKSGLSSRMCVLRLPFGTGNDGADGRTLAETLELLTSEVELSLNPAVRIRRNSTPKVHYAFNIASVGIDAFISDMTNHLKRRIPGDVYKLWIDLACVFYNRVYRVAEMGLYAALGGEPLWSGRKRWVLAVMGASGHRTYGSNQRILPGEQNVCCVADMPLWEKLMLKGRFATGKHDALDRSVLLRADRLVLSYDRKVLMQVDGETVRLGKQDFPVVMELTEPCMPVLRKKHP